MDILRVQPDLPTSQKSGTFALGNSCLLPAADVA